MNTHVLYHADCPDGFGAALVAWQKFGDEATYIPVRYNEPPPDIPPGTDVFIVDFSYPGDVLFEMVSGDEQKTITVLDHHKTAEEELRDIHHPHICAVFDKNESGATLAWKFWYGHLGNDAPMPPFFKYLRDRDLWLWEMPYSKEFSAGLSSYPKEFELWNSMVSRNLGLINDGVAILRYQDRMVDALCRNAEFGEIWLHRTMEVNTPLLGSEVGNKLCMDNPDIDFAAVYSRQEDGRWRYELRSVGEFDVSEIAKKYGGGGHRNAAGFIVDSPIDS